MQSDFKALMKKSKMLLTEPIIRANVARLARELSKEYAGDVPVLLCALKGAYPFFSDLTKRLEFPHEVEFIRCESYKENRKDDNHEIFFSPNTELQGRRILVIEDIVDTGATAELVADTLECALPQDIKVCTLILKVETSHFEPDFAGIMYTGTDFLFGYGLDLNGLWRHLPDVYRYTP